MTVRNRKDARNALNTEMSGITNFQTGFDHLTKDNAGQSPFYCLESFSSHPPPGYPAESNLFEFIAWVFVKRTNDDEDNPIDPNDTEDELDDIDFEMRTMLEDWSNAEMIAPSETDYEDLDDGQYKIERYFIQIDWEGS